MTDILSSGSGDVLERFAQGNLLLGFDFDGTLAPIVTLPEEACMRASTHRLLREVAIVYPCAVISGRAREDVIDRLAGIPVLHVSGNHGLEPWAEEARYARRIAEWVEHLTARLACEPGVIIENKTYSVSVHYRTAPHTVSALQAIHDAIAGLHGARQIGGKQVVNLVPCEAPTKGTALDRVCRLLACDTAMYIGDDDTDEEVFSHACPGRLLSVRVGPVSRSHATYLLRHQREIDGLLEKLLALRADALSTS